MKKRVADIIMETLVELGITDCFAVVGGGAMYMDNALSLCKEMHVVFHHHEQACAMAADAYARYSGKMAAVCVTSGPGATNTLTGVAGGWMDSIPMLILSGQVRYAVSVPQSGLPLRYRGMQEFDIIHSVQNMTKYATMVTDPLSIRKELYFAAQIAMDGRRGPVWLDVPQDIQSAIVDEDKLYSPEKYVSDRPQLDKKEITLLLNALQKAERPCILGGSGIVSGHSREQYEAFVEKMKIPVLGGAWVTDDLYTDHPLFYGKCGDIGPRTGNFILQNADVILTLGNSLGFKQTGFNQKEFAPNAKIFMVDADAAEAQKPGLRVEKLIHADVKDFFKISQECSICFAEHTAWIQYCDQLKKRFSAFEALQNIDMDEEVNKYQFWKKFQENEPDDSLLALGNSSCNSAKLQICVKKRGQRALSNYNCGSMGYDLPAAIGAAVAAHRRVYCVTGDGSFMMNLQELQTIVHYNLPIHIIVFSNGAYGTVYQSNKNLFNSQFVGCTKESGISFPDFARIAEAFQFQYMCCKTNREVEACVKKIFDTPGRVLLEIKEKLDDPVIPKLMSRLDTEGKFVTPKLQDMYPFLEQEELDSLMLQ